MDGIGFRPPTLVCLAGKAGTGKVGEAGGDSGCASLSSGHSGQAGGQSRISSGSWLAHLKWGQNGPSVPTPNPWGKGSFSENALRKEYLTYLQDRMTFKGFSISIFLPMCLSCAVLVCSLKRVPVTAVSSGQLSPSSSSHSSLRLDRNP